MDTVNMKTLKLKPSVEISLEQDSLTDDITDSAEIIRLQYLDESSSSQPETLCSKICNIQFIKKRLPIIEWLPKYSIDDMKGDLIAGITVALAVIPQGLALALLAGLPPQYGLYTAFMGCFMYTLFGSCKDLTIGPTAIMSIMTADHATAGGVVYVILITFLSGCIQLSMGVLNLGFLVTFISSSVVSGFTSAAALTIAMTQMAGIFGIKSKSQGFIQDVYHFFQGIGNGGIQYWDMAMGLTSIFFLLALKYCGSIKLNYQGSRQCKKIAQTFLQTVSTARNALLVLLCTGVVAILLNYNIDVLTLTQKVKPGLPPFAFPTFSTTIFDNTTNQTIHKDFIHIVQDMGSGLVIIPLIGILEAIAVAKSFAKGKKLDATQEMIAIGMCNIMSSFVSSYPTTGSFSRTAINHSSGVRTTAGGIVTGSLVLLALGVMSPYFQYIPKAALSALIVVAVLNMVHLKDVLVMWRTNKLDLLPFLATFIFSFLLGLEYGIIIGVGVSVCLLLLEEARPKILLEERKTVLGHLFLYVKPDRTILFPSAEKLQTKITKAVPDYEEHGFYCVLFDGEHISSVDYTTAMSLKSMINNFKSESVHVLFINLKLEVQKAIRGSVPEEFLNFLSQEDAENYIDDLSIRHNPPPAYGGDSVIQDLTDPENS